MVPPGTKMEKGTQATMESIIVNKELPAPICLGTALNQIEAHIISEALRITEGNKTHAAEYLNINRTTLIEKIKRYKILPTTWEMT